MNKEPELIQRARKLLMQFDATKPSSRELIEEAEVLKVALAEWEARHNLKKQSLQ